jgi:hypothetical protein
MPSLLSHTQTKYEGEASVKTLWVSILICAEVSVMAAKPVLGQKTSVSTSQLSGSEVRQLEKHATTREQFHALAAYYQQRAQQLREKAAEQHIEWMRRTKDVSGPSAKPPRPVDSARNLYEYYRDEADRSEQRAAEYGRKANIRTAPDGAAL